MMKFILLTLKIKRDLEYIDNVMFGNFDVDECTCLLTFKSIGEKPSGWSFQLINHINYYIENCDASISASCSSSNNIVLKLKVKLS